MLSAHRVLRAQLRSGSALRRFSTASAFDSFPDFSIVDSTLREGEQFATAEFTPQDRVYVAKILDRMGVDYIEMVNPMAGKQAIEDCETVAKLGLKSKIVCHTRCHISDVKAAVNTGIQGVNMYMATSPILAKHSHGKGIDVVIENATEVVKYVQSHGLEVRFYVWTHLATEYEVYKAMDALGVDRVGVADTVGIATPSQVREVISKVREAIRPETGIEFHTHNDTGCCIANALVALEAGATHIDTCVLGIGERNGITPLGGFLGRMYTMDKERLMKKYDLGLLRHLEKYVSQRAHVVIPFNNYITGSCAFTHKAGVLDPSDFGVERRIELAHRLTGWNAMKQRTQDLGLEIPDEKLKIATVMIKDLSDERTIGLEELDKILMSLCSKKQPKTAFISWGSDKTLEHKAEHYRQETQSAIEALDAPEEELGPNMTLMFEGHLFDKAILNRLLDLAVDSPCSFKVIKLDVPNDNEEESKAIIKIMGTLTDIELLRQKYEKLLATLDDIAHTRMIEITEDENTTPKESEEATKLGHGL